MNTIHGFEQIEQAFRSFITAYNGGSPLTGIDVTLNVDGARSEFGDLSSNAALIVGKAHKRNPRDVAQDVVHGFVCPGVERIEIAGPGFINIFCSAAVFDQAVRALTDQHTDYFVCAPHERSIRFSIEFVSANPTGPLHIGHGRNGIIGDVLSRITKFLGYSTTSEFYINDAGNQMQLLAQSLRARCYELLGEPLVLPEGGYQGDYLIDIARTCIEEHGAELHALPDQFFLEYAKTRLLAQQKDTLQRYGISFDVWFSELQLHTTGAIERTLRKLIERGAAYEKDGALWLSAAALGDEKDRVVRRSNGEYTYVAADIAYLENKIERGFDTLIIVVGQDHHGYVARLKAALTALGHNPDRLDVLLYQVVTLKNAGEVMKLSKRAGRIVSLSDIIDTVGADIARFFYLNRKADAHLDFDIDLASKHTDENPVYYIQYAYVRIVSMLEKAAQMNLSVSEGLALSEAGVLGVSERLIIKKIVALRGLLRHIVATYQTHMLAYYTIELAHMLHAYYAAQRIIDPAAPQQTQARLQLMIVVRDTFIVCFKLLGIQSPERM